MPPQVELPVTDVGLDSRLNIKNDIVYRAMLWCEPVDVDCMRAVRYKLNVKGTEI